MPATVFITDTPPDDATQTNSPTSGASSGQSTTGPDSSPGQNTLDLLTKIRDAPSSNEKAVPKGSESAPIPANDDTPGAKTVQFLQGVKDGTLPPPKKPYETTATSIGTNIGSGLSEGAIDAVGAPVDLVNWGMRKAGLPVSDTPFGGSQSIKNAFGAATQPLKDAGVTNVTANPDEVVPQNTAESIARATGAGIAGAAVPESLVAGGAAKLAAVAPKTAEALQGAFGSGANPASMASNAAIGGVSGATGETAAAAVPDDSLKPIARLLGGFGGGVGAAAATHAIPMGSAAVTAAQDFKAPMTEAGQKQLAADMFAKGLVDRNAVQQRLSAYQGPEVPGSMPLTSQVADDIGASSMQRAAETVTPVPFNQRRAEQNEARVGVIKSLQPTGDPAQVSAHIRNQLADIDQMTAGVSRQAQARAQTAAAPIGQGTPEAHGAAMREGLAQNEMGAKAWEKSLWQAVDPDGKLAMGAAPISNEARRIESTKPQAAKEFEGEEAAILHAAKELASVSKFSEVTALRSRISDEMRVQRGPNGNATVLARLTQLRGVVERAIEDAAEHKAGQEAEAVRSGAMKPEETMVAKWQAKADAFQRAKAEAAGGNSGGNYSTDTGGGSARVSGPSGTGLQKGRGSGNAAGTSGVSGDATANLDAEAANRIKAASAATKERAATFKEGPVGDALAVGDSRILDSQVGAKFFKPGPTGAEAVQTFKTAAGNDPEAMKALEGFAGLSLRKAAMNSDGTLDPAKFASWQKAHGDALRAMPDVAAKFETAAKAADAVADSTAMRAAALDGYQKGAIGKFLNVSDPQDVVKTVGSIFGQKDAIGSMRQLASEVKDNPDAREGLRKAVADFLTSKAISNTDDVKSDVFQTFVRQNKAVLAQVFSHDELKGIEAVAKELANVNRIAKQAALPGRSTTAQDLLSQKSKEGGSHLSILTEMIVAGSIGLEEGVKTAVTLAAASGVKSLVHARRAAGMDNVKDLIRGMLLHPELAKAALERASVGPHLSGTDQAKAAWNKFRQQLNRVSTITAQRMISPTKQPDKANR